MKKLRLAALAATSILATAQADAATFVWTSGTYSPGVTSPSPLLAGDILSIEGSGNKSFGDGAFVNQSGVVNWVNGTIILSGGSASVTNAGTWNMLGDNVMTFSNGGGTFTNTGLLAKTGGSATSNFAANNFINSGTIDAQVGTIELNGGNNTINAGSVFSGAGTVLMNTDGAFNGSFTSSNLDLSSAVFTGSSAVLNGSMDFLSGSLAGTWNVAAGSTLNVNGSSNKSFSTGTFDNDGTIVWNNGTLILGGGSANIVNDGTFTSTADTTMTFSNGGGVFTNNGLLQKTGGTGNTAIGVVSLVNAGTISAQTGTITLSGGLTFNNGSAFTGAGTVSILSNATFNDAFSSANLDLNGGVYTGNSAVLNGSVDFLSGTIGGTWNVASGSTLNVNGSANKGFSTGTFDNDGTVVWNEGTLFLGGGSANVVNDGTFTSTADTTMTFSNGGGVFTNNGLLQKTGGTGNTALGVVSLVNTGTISAQTGTITLSGGLTFNDGSAFTGAGTVSILSNATFNGAFSSANLDFNGGTYTGNSASLSGSADFRFGSFGGTWNVASGATLNIDTSSNKGFGTGTFDNDGTMVWNDGTLFLSGGGANLRNDGLFLATGDNVMTFSNGGGAFVNNGVIRKTGSTGTTTLSPPVTNNGMIDVQSGTIAVSGNFVNPGTIAGTGTFQVGGTLTNNGTIAPGNAGTGVGTLSLTGNYIQGAGGLFSVGFGPGGTSDLFNISGAAALGGTLGLTCLSCTFNVGDLITILDSVGNLSGMFANSTATGFNSGFAYTILYDTTLDRVQVRIDNVGVVTPPPVSGGVPEPATWAMMLLGFGAIGSMLRRRARPLARVRYG